ncbi:4Fe-4S binding protein [Anaerobacillus sp. CMMVII]|uniref:4Fe-4S binding protein n=1 Tax=Anaerobacillus sp. CMMVII TaxID=2755588 RepID=UPI0021B6F6D6|nr:4Fe-4S binding protein [Anaerobacillus sp. CMMVII]MCT8139088.1 4Fe-4S binding protein [Anaerobacillus sp. CMMVII]
MKKLRKKTQFITLFAFFLVPIFDIFRLDLINGSFYLFQKAFSFETGFIYLIAVLFLVIFFVSISKWYERHFCSWICPHNTVVGFLYKLSSHPLLIKQPRFKKVGMVIISLVVSLLASYGVLAYFISPTYLAHTIMQFQYLTVVGNLLLFFTAILFILIHSLKQKFCANTCPYGHFQKLFSDKNRPSRKSIFTGVNLLLLLLLGSLFIALVTLSFISKQFTVSISENIAGVQLETNKIFSYEIQIENYASDLHEFRITSDTPSHWEVLFEDILHVDAGENQKSSLILKIPKEDFNKNFLITVKVTNLTNNKEESKKIAIHS